MSARSSRDLRRLVLKLAASTDEDRKWVLSTLGEDERERLLQLLSDADQATSGRVKEAVDRPPSESPDLTSAEFGSGVMSLLLAEPRELAIRLRSVMDDAEVQAWSADPRHGLWKAKLGPLTIQHARLTEETQRVLRAYLLEASHGPQLAMEMKTAPVERRRWFARRKGWS